MSRRRLHNDRKQGTNNRGSTGNIRDKFVVLTEEEITKMMKKAAREGAKEGIAAYESKQAIVMAERTEKVRNSAKTLVQHYRQLKKMKDTSVYDQTQ